MLPPADRRDRILGLALPIIGGMVSQNLLNLVDTGFVSVLGDQALAGVGIASFLNFMALSFVTGLASGVQAMAARRKGEGRTGEMAVPLNGGLLMAVGFGVPIMMATWAIAPTLLPILGNDENVGAIGASYLRIRLLGVPAVGMNFAFRGYWNAIDMSRLYLRTIVLMHVVNAVLDYVLIFGAFGAPELGTDGAGWASFAATWTGAVFYFVQAFGRARSAGFLAGVPPLSTMLTMLRTSVPAGLNSFLFAAGMTTFFSIVARLGVSQLAAANVLLNLLLVALLPAIGFGLSAATLVGQALGEGDADLARRWGWDVIRTAFPVVALIATVGFIAPDLVLSVFLRDPNTLGLARAPLMLLAVTIPLDVVGTVLMNALLGAGDSRRVLMVAVTAQWVLFLPAAYLIGPVLGFGLFGVFAAQGVYRILQGAVFAWIWRSGAWAEVKL